MTLSVLAVAGLVVCFVVAAMVFVSFSRAGAVSDAARGRAQVDVHSLLSLPNVSDLEVAAAPLVAVFSSSTGICAAALQEVEEFGQILSGTLRVPPTSLFLLLDADEDRAKYFYKTRDLSLPVLRADDTGLVAQLYGSGDRAKVDELHPMHQFDLDAESRPPMLFLIDAEEGRILGGQPIAATPTEPGWKLAVVQRILRGRMGEGV